MRTYATFIITLCAITGFAVTHANESPTQTLPTKCDVKSTLIAQHFERFEQQLAAVQNTDPTERVARELVKRRAIALLVDIQRSIDVATCNGASLGTLSEMESKLQKIASTTI